MIFNKLDHLISRLIDLETLIAPINFMETAQTILRFHLLQKITILNTLQDGVSVYGIRVGLQAQPI